MIAKTKFWGCLVMTLLFWAKAVQADPITVDFSGVFSDMPTYQQGDPSNPPFFTPGSILELSPDIRYVLVSGQGWKLIPGMLFPVMEANPFSGRVTYDPSQNTVLAYNLSVAGITLSENDLGLLWSENGIELRFANTPIGRGEIQSISQVPEPAAAALMSCGILITGLIKKKRKPGRRTRR
jgi:hypothetical protein